MFKLFTIFGIFVAVGYYYYRYGGTSVKIPEELQKEYDFIIAGGGTAGCVLAARLSEDPTVNVLLIEAGGEETDFWFSHIPGFVTGLQMTEFDWMYLTEPQKYCCNAMNNKQVRWPRGKGLGGCSTHNYVNYVRCSPADYDHWAYDLKNPGWSYQDVLPYFKKLENNQMEHLKGDTKYHGFDGPLKINIGKVSPLGQNLYEALKREGYKTTDDLNGKELDGFGYVQFNVDEWGTRMSTAKAYLRPAMKRQNLHVIVNAHVTKVIIESNEQNKLKATGVEYVHNNKKYSVKAKREVIVSGGAINSPQILMLSGIGPRKQLEQFSIPMLVDNAAVGANLDDHIACSLTFKTNQNGRSEVHDLGSWQGFLTALSKYYTLGHGPLNRTATEIMGFLDTGLLSAKYPVDLQLYFASIYCWIDEQINLTPEASERQSVESVGETTFMLAAVHLHPSDKGEIRLASADPLGHPIIDHHYFKTSVDVDVLVEGFRIMLHVIEKSPELKAYDIKFAEKSAVPDCDQYKPLSDDYLKCSVRNRASTLYHPVGTCRMGQRGENSVVDAELKVHGVDGLRVVDASVFPDQVSGNTHIPVVMVAEKASDLIKAMWKTD